MAYELVIGAELWHQIMTLPVDARAVVGEAMRTLELVPWNGTPVPAANTDAPLRRLDFGPPGTGFVHYLILEDDQRIDLLELVWVDL